MDKYSSIVTIPAYDNDNNGLVIEFKLTAISAGSILIKTKGKVAKALQKNFKRCIEIMTSVNKSWGCLERVGYLLECNSNQFRVRDAKSSSMALCIALMNIARAISGHSPVAGLSGTGVLRIDGTFDHAHREEKKYLAATQMISNLSKFITPQDCKNLLELESLIMKLN